VWNGLIAASGRLTANGWSLGRHGEPPEMAFPSEGMAPDRPGITPARSLRELMSCPPKIDSLFLQWTTIPTDLPANLGPPEARGNEAAPRHLCREGPRNPPGAFRARMNGTPGPRTGGIIFHQELITDPLCAQVLGITRGGPPIRPNPKYWSVGTPAPGVEFFRVRRWPSGRPRGDAGGGRTFPTQGRIPNKDKQTVRHCVSDLRKEYQKRDARARGHTIVVFSAWKWNGIEWRDEAWGSSIGMELWGNVPPKRTAWQSRAPPTQGGFPGVGGMSLSRRRPVSQSKSARRSGRSRPSRPNRSFTRWMFESRPKVSFVRAGVSRVDEFRSFDIGPLCVIGGCSDTEVIPALEFRSDKELMGKAISTHRLRVSVGYQGFVRTDVSPKREIRRPRTGLASDRGFRQS
jgi:hypothetical protein